MIIKTRLIECSVGFRVGLSIDESSFVDRCFENLAELVCSIASNFPAFGESVAHETLSILEEILSKIDLLMSGFDSSMKAEDDDLYREAIRLRLAKLEIIGLNISSRIDYDIASSYVSVRCKSVSENKKIRILDEGHFDEIRHDPEIVNVEDLIAVSDRLLILGNPGSGKTTFLKWSAVAIADGKILDNFVPLFVPLRNYSGRDLPGIEDIFRESYPNLSKVISNSWLTSMMSSRKVIVLIDSVDEVPKSRRARVKEWINEILITYPALRVIVTSRPSAIESKWLDNLNFQSYELLPMGESEIHEFVDSWHYSLSTQKLSYEDKAIVYDMKNRLKKQLSQNNDILELSSTPLICAAICAINYVKRGYIPKDVNDLYESLSRMLIEARDNEQGIGLYGDIGLNYIQKYNLISQIAYKSSTSQTLDIPKDLIKSEAEEYIVVTNVKSNINFENVVDYLIERSGLIRLYSHNSYEFIHRSLQEYLTASRFIKEGRIDILKNLYSDDQWHEIIVMSASMMGRAAADELISFLILKGDESKQGRKYFILAARCRSAASEVSKSVQDDLEIRIKTFIPPSDKKSAVLVSEYGNKLLESLEFSESFNKNQAIWSANALEMINSDESWDALREYCVSDDEDVLGNVIDICIAGENRGRHIESFQIDHLSVLKLRNARNLGFMKYVREIGYCSIHCNYDEFNFQGIENTNANSLLIECFTNKKIEEKFSSAVQYIMFHGCRNVKHIDLNAEGLDTLLLYSMPNLRRINIHTSKKIKRLVAFTCYELEHINTSSLNFDQCSELSFCYTRLAEANIKEIINRCRSLRKLSLAGHSINLKDVQEDIRKRITYLNLNIEDIFELDASWMALSSLAIGGDFVVDGLNTTVIKLDLGGRISSIPSHITSLENLQTLIIRTGISIDNLSIIQEAKNIRTLYIDTPPPDTDFSFLKKMEKLETLYIKNYPSAKLPKIKAKIRNGKLARNTILR